MSTGPETLNAPGAPEGGIGLLLANRSSIAVLAILVLGVLATSFVGPRLDGREPPPLKPTIPFIGHLIAIIRDRGYFLNRLAAHRMPIASLPILGGKMYAIWDATLIQAVYRNKNMSFVPFVIEFAQRELAFDDHTDKIVRETDLMDAFFGAVHEGMSVQNTNRMNATALNYISRRLNSFGQEEQVIPNLYLWARDFMTAATTEALYGAENPMEKQPSLLEDIWTFETGLDLLMMNVYPTVTASKAYQARKRLQAALVEYYAKGADQNDDTAGITRCRGTVLRKFGVKKDQLGVIELALLHVATANTIPTLFWFVAYIVTRPELVSRLREEALGAVEQGTDGEMTVGVHTLSEKCPVLVSCYREAIRLTNKSVGNRRVMTDTMLSDGKGRTYLLKEGTNVQMPVDPVHHLEDVWGPNPAEFSADRFMDEGKPLTDAGVKAKRVSYIPFGGGRHLCPGRNFAFAENLGFVITLVLGFDVSPIDGDWKSFKEPPRVPKLALGQAVSKPMNNGDGFGVRIKRREGWENTKWKFTSS